MKQLADPLQFSLPMASVATSPFTQHADRLLPPIEAALAVACQFDKGCPTSLAEAIRYSLLAPGKRLRPMLVVMAAEACEGQRERALPAACAVEMVHAYSLIHDDLPAMDDDDLRRGRPTCHIAFGEALAILAGDALLALAFETLAKGVTPPETAAACCATLAEAAGPAQLVGGQADDLAGPGANGTLDDLKGIHARKTGALIRASLRLGGLTASADTAALDTLDAYGARIGLAFQIADDLLDARGQEAQAGKRVGKDAAAGKLTYPGLLGIVESQRLARQLIEEAIDALAPLPGRTEALEALAQYVLERNR